MKYRAEEVPDFLKEVPVLASPLSFRDRGRLHLWFQQDRPSRRFCDGQGRRLLYWSRRRLGLLALENQGSLDLNVNVVWL